MTEATARIATMQLPGREFRRYALIALSLLFVVVAVVGALVILSGVEAQTRDTRRTYEILQHSRHLILHLVDAETGQRGYLLTQDPVYLDPYRASIASIDSTYQQLLALASEEPGQRRQIETLAEAIAQKRAELAATINLAAEGQRPEALAVIRSNESLALMEHLRASLRNFIERENMRLAERSAEAERTRLWLVALIVAALAGSAVLTYLLFTSAQRQLARLSRASDQLHSLNVELERRVHERTAELEVARTHAERERARVEALLQETNHRIGNSLATVSSMLGLQMARSDSPEVRSALDAAQGRVQAIASGHRRLRLGDDLETVHAEEFLVSMVDDLLGPYKASQNIEVETRVAPMIIRARDATTVGIIVAELVTNAIKHAFPQGTGGHIWTSFERNHDGVPVLTVEDDGRGLDKKGASSDSGLGAMIVRQLASQFGGEPAYDARPGGGTRVVLMLPSLKVDDGATEA